MTTSALGLIAKQFPAEVQWVFRGDPLPSDSDPVLDLIAESAEEPRVKGALVLLVKGFSIRKAAQAFNLAKNAVFGAANRTGVSAYTRGSLGRQYRRLAGMANDELERRLEEEPERVQTRDLTAISGVSTDKAIRLEGWEKSLGEGRQDPTAIFDMLRERGRKTSLTVTVTTEDDAIDVTPRPGTD